MKKIIEKLPQYRKAVVAGAGFVVITLTATGVVVPEGVDTEVVKAFDSFVALLTAVGVARVPNTPAKVDVQQ